MRLAMLLTGTLALAACGSVQEEEMPSDVEINILTESHYQIIVPTTESQPADSAAGEQARQQLLARVMKDNGYCPGGWQVADRRVEQRDETADGTQDDIYYDVMCK